MKKLVLLVIVFALAGFVAYKLLSKTTVPPTVKKDQPLAISANSGKFNGAFTDMLNQYYTLRNALVEWDTVKADQAAYDLSEKANALPLNELKADSNIVMTAQSLGASIGSEAKGFMGETGIEQKRRSFNMLTDEIYNLVRTVKYDQETIYHVRCPMAFKDSEEGYWLDDSNRIVNPYLGKYHPTYKSKMLTCGEINDSLDFRKK